MKFIARQFFFIKFSFAFSEPTKPVIFGTEPAILDTESFSEISLDQPPDQETYPPQDDQFSTDYSKPFNPLTQATQLTASLSQLPSVASSVFSSFSNILRGNSPTPNISTEQQHIDPYNAPPVQTLSDVPFVDGSLAYPSEESAVPAAIPTFYSTSDPAFPPPAPTLSPPPANTGCGNAYRLTTKRKTYAPAPGLTYQDNQPVSSAFPSYAPPLPNQINEPNFPGYQTTTYENTAAIQPPSQNNKFSLTSFFSTPLLEKITGSGTVSHSQDIPASNVPDVYPTVTPPAPVTTVNPELFETNPQVVGVHPSASENLPTYSTQSQTYQPTPPLSTPIFFNPAQHTNLPAVDQAQLNAYGTPESFSNISSIPPSSAPPPGNVSNYRLRGKPHYRNPLSLTTTAAPHATPFFQAAPNPTIPSEIFNPLNTSIAETPDHSSKLSGFSQPSPPNVAFFNQPQSVPLEPTAPNAGFVNQPQSVPVEQKSFNVAFFNQPASVPVEPKAPDVNFFNQSQSATVAPNVIQFNQFYPSSSGNTHSLGTFGTGNVQQPPIADQGFNTQQPVPHQQPVQHQQTVQQQQSVQHQQQTEQQKIESQPDQHHQPLLLHQFQEDPIQPLIEQEEQTFENLPVQDLNQHSAFPSDQTQLASSIDTPQANIFQQFEPTKKADQLFAAQFQAPTEQLEKEQQVVTPLQPLSFFNPFGVPTSHSQSTDQQSNFSSELFTPFQVQNQTPTFYPIHTDNAGLVESNQYSQEKISNAGESIFQPKFEEEALEHSQAQFANLDLKPELIATEASFDPVELKQDDNKSETFIPQTDTASTDSRTASNFDNFFGSPAKQQSANLEPCQSEPIPTSTLASSFFATPTNPSPADWFNSPQSVVEPSINRLEDDINRNTQLPTETPSNFFATNNNNQVSSPPNYFQIQNFFNNPPLIADSKEQDSNFNFIENNLINKRLHNLTLHKGSIETDGGSISSNIVEPPSSAQSEFSEFAELNPETSQSDEYLGEQQVHNKMDNFHCFSFQNCFRQLMCLF